MSFSDNFSRIQAARGETNYRIAKELGVSQTTIANWKSGVSKPRGAYIKLVANHFGCTESDLLREAD